MNKQICNERGSALLMALGVMAMLAIIAVLAVDNSTNDIEMSFNQLHTDQAFYIAEAGCERALVDLNADDSWRSGYNRVSFGEGVYTVRLIDSLVDTTLSDTVLILAHGFVDGAESSVEMTTVPIWKHPFAFGMFGDAGISLDKGTCTDSYNSDSGSYAATVLDSLAPIGSNGTISSSKDVNFGGDISVATPGGITLGVNNTVNGDTTSTADSVILDAIPDDEFDWARTASRAQIGISGAGWAYDHTTKTLVTGAFANVVLSSGVYYFSEINLAQGSSITLAPGASVIIYMTDDFVLGQGSTVNDGGKPTDFQVYSKGSTLQFDQDNSFYGSFYGPNAHIQYDQTSEVYGALIGSSVQLDGGACLHYDRSLGAITKGTTGEMVKVAWREVM